MNKDIYLYLAGSLTYLYNNNKFDLATEWRNKISEWAEDNNIKIFNPAKNFLNEKSCGYSGKLAVDQNNFFLDKTTIMIVSLEYLDYSPGTIYEMVSYKKMGKPVIVFGEKEHWSPHINSCVSQNCKNIEDVIEVLTNMFL